MILNRPLINYLILKNKDYLEMFFKEAYYHHYFFIGKDTIIFFINFTYEMILGNCTLIYRYCCELWKEKTSAHCYSDNILKGSVVIWALLSSNGRFTSNYVYNPFKGTVHLFG